MRQKSISSLQWDVEIAVWLLAGFTVPSFMAMVQFSACPSISSGIWCKLDKIIPQGTALKKLTIGI